MRTFLLLLASWLLAQAATAAPLPADTATRAIDRLPATGLLLDKGWRYHPGGNPAWARPDFDDSGWDTLNPRTLARAAQPGVYWLRRRFRLGDSLRQRTLVLQLSRLGTADLYLNGRLLTDSAHRARTRGAFRAPGLLEVPANGPAEQVLAMRLVPRPPG